MYPSCLDATFAEKARWVRVTRQDRKASNRLAPKEGEKVGTKVLGLNFISNSKKIGSNLPSKPRN